MLAPHEAQAGEQLGDVVVALWHGVVGEAEGGRRGDDDAVAVRDEGVVVGTFDLDYLATHRAAWGFFRDRRTDLYGALCAPRPS